MIFFSDHQISRQQEIENTAKTKGRKLQSQVKKKKKIYKCSIVCNDEGDGDLIYAVTKKNK